MSGTELEYIERETGADPRIVVIWLHGLGADGHDFEPIVDELRLGFPARFVFPHAPVRRITINGGMPMRAWFDILGFDRDAHQDEQAIRASASAVRALIDREAGRGVPTDRIVLAGFSQGGAVALHTGLREPRPLGGVLALSAYLPLADSLHAEKSAANLKVPVLMAHGDADPVIPVEMALAGKRLLEAEGYAVEWRVYPMGHTVCAEEIRDVAAWLTRVAAGSAGAAGDRAGAAADPGR